MIVSVTVKSALPFQFCEYCPSQDLYVQKSGVYRKNFDGVKVDLVGTNASVTCKNEYLCNWVHKSTLKEMGGGDHKTMD